MEKVKTIIVDDIELFKKINTFQCKLGIISPEACEKIREREKLNKFNNDKKLYLITPFCCEKCDDWFKKHQEVFRKRKEYLQSLENSNKVQVQIQTSVQIQKQQSKERDMREQNTKVILPEKQLNTEDIIYEGPKKWKGKCSICGEIKRLKLLNKRICKTCYEKMLKAKRTVQSQTTNIISSISEQDFSQEIKKNKQEIKLDQKFKQESEKGFKQELQEIQPKRKIKLVIRKPLTQEQELKESEQTQKPMATKNSDLVHEGPRKWRGKCAICGKMNRLKIVSKRICKTCYKKMLKEKRK